MQLPASCPVPPPSSTNPLQLTSDNDNRRTDMHEIDFEFINAWPASTSGGIWTNSFINGLLQLEQLWMPWDLMARTGHKTFDTFQVRRRAAVALVRVLPRAPAC